MGPAGGSVRPALKGNAADKYKALIISAEKGKARKEAVERQRSFAAALDDEAVRNTMTRFDKSKTGNLDAEELAQLMQHFAGGQLPTSEEVLFVLHAADVKDHNECVDVDELADSIKIWKNYLDNKPIIEGVFELYDTDHSGRIDENELTRLLTILNDGLEPLASEVGWVMHKADGHGHGYLLRGSHTVVDTTDAHDGISRQELMYAISLWYTYQDMGVTEKVQALNEVANSKQSACCTLM